MNYRLLSLIENTPDGFEYRPHLEQKDVRRWPFALLALDLHSAEIALSPFGNALAGIIVTFGSEPSWNQCSQLVFHYTVPKEFQKHLVILLPSHLFLLAACQQAENRINMKVLDLARAFEDNTRNKQEFAQIKESLVQELAERRRAEEELFQQKNLISTIIESTSEAIYTKDTSGKYQSINEAGARMLGYKVSDVIGHTDMELLSPETAGKFHNIDEYIISSGRVSRQEQAVVIGSKTYIFLNHKVPWRDNSGKIIGVIGISNDITENKEHEKEQHKMEKLESLGVLAGGIAHDFNNILTGIMGNISLAQVFLDPNHKSYKSLVEAEKASVRASELAYQLLTFARGGEPVKKVVSLQYLIDESITLALHGSNVKGVVDIPDSIHAIEADEGQMSQVFYNIIINATQAMPGGGTLSITAQNDTVCDNNTLSLPSGTYIRLIFADEGCGISDENIKKIFDPYFTTKSAGNGLGLASVHSIISKHGGHIGVSSIVGKGTAFTIHLPSTGKIYSKHPAGIIVQTILDNQGGAILVMDDDEFVRTLATGMLEYMGYKVTTCKNGIDAITQYKKGMDSGTPFWAVIMDLTIPGGMGGRETAQRILAIDPKASLIVSSGYSNDPIMSDYRTYGFLGALVKPYKIKELGQLLTSLLPVNR